MVIGMDDRPATIWHPSRRLILSMLASMTAVQATHSLWNSNHSTAMAAQTSDAVINWNATATSTLVIAGEPSPIQFRALALVHAAIFDAVNTIDRRFTPFAIDTRVPEGVSMEAAVAAAAHGVLLHLYPAQRTALDAALKTSLEKAAPEQSRVEGITLGEDVAKKFIALRSKDGVDTRIEYKPQSGAGLWQPTPPTFARAVSVHWGNIVPFTFKRVGEFEVPAPPALGSAIDTRDLTEVRSVGARNSTSRTADQTAAAIFWSLSTPIFWNTVAREVTADKTGRLVDKARLFALLNMAGADATVLGFAIKYQYNRWRPITAIRSTLDPQWEPLLVTPAHPDYISGHCITSDASAQVLRSFLDSDKARASYTYPANNGVTRSFTSLSQMTKEVGDARIWGGIHTRTADDVGGLLGRKLAERALQNHLRPIGS